MENIDMLTPQTTADRSALVVWRPFPVVAVSQGSAVTNIERSEEEKE